MVDLTMSPLPMEEHTPDPNHLEKADKAWDAIDQILDFLVQETSCSNQAIRDLLTNISRQWPEAGMAMAMEIRQQKRRAG